MQCGRRYYPLQMPSYCQRFIECILSSFWLLSLDTPPAFNSFHQLKPKPTTQIFKRLKIAYLSKHQIWVEYQPIFLMRLAAVCWLQEQQCILHLPEFSSFYLHGDLFKFSLRIKTNEAFRYQLYLRFSQLRLSAIWIFTLEVIFLWIMRNSNFDKGFDKA